MSNLIEWSEVRKEHHLLELEGCDGSEDEQGPIHAYSAWVKWDGCIEIEQCYNGYEWDHTCSQGACRDGLDCCRQNFHICDIDQMIFALQNIKRRAMNHFTEWPV